MAAYKCKMCGGDLQLEAGLSVCECEYCGTKQTVPNGDSEKKMTLFGRAGRLLRGCEFDKAAGVFETIVADYPDEAEAYWGLVLCHYGIEYVDDPATGKKVPTCHRSSFDSVLEDDNFEQACENADVIARRVYRDEARAIDELRKSIIEVSGKEEPYDIFISYKEIDYNGNRTLDSVLAQDLYDALTEKGYRVFFSRITLEDKLGKEYEPYIFAALNSAKIMLVVGTEFDHFDAVWVKNEWSRFLKMIASGQKKTLIPCYKNMDAYDMPKEFAKLTAQDMGKIGAMQDLVRGVGKLLDNQEAAPKVEAVREPVVKSANSTINSLLERMFLFLEDGRWNDANAYAEKVLDAEPKNAEAYVGKLMVSLHVRVRSALPENAYPINNNEHYKKAVRFGDHELIAELEGYNAHIVTRNKNMVYDSAKAMMAGAKTEQEYKDAAEKFGAISTWRDGAALEKECLELAESARKDAIYGAAEGMMRSAKTPSEYRRAEEQFESVSDWKDSAEQIALCQQRIAELAAKKQSEKVSRGSDEGRSYKRKMILCSAAAAAVLAAILLVFVVIPTVKYNNAVALMEAGRYEEAIEAFAQLEGRKDSESKIEECKIGMLDARYDAAVALAKAGDAQGAYDAFIALGDYKDSADKAFVQTVCQRMQDAEAGDIVCYGQYEQDGDTSNGKEDIEWLVLDEQDGKLLLISRVVLDLRQFHPTNDAGVSWKNSYLREWLNEEFMNAAFNREEQLVIPTVTLPADVDLVSGEKTGNDTEDRVFLLSVQEVEKFFPENNERDWYTKADGERVTWGTNVVATKRNTSAYYWYSEGSVAASPYAWWLRSDDTERWSSTPGISYVSAAGMICPSCKNAEHIGVRPAMWIDLNT